MNHFTRIQLTDRDLIRRLEIFDLLETVCQTLEPTNTQFSKAQQSYQGVADWLAGSDDPLLASVLVYLQGSGALGTMIRPIGRDEFDIDLICLLIGVDTNISPAALKSVVGNRLKEHTYYRKILIEKKRCWRLNYAGDFHLDLSPTIKNVLCANNGELVPDRKLQEYHPTNPKGYKKIFVDRCVLSPTMMATTRIRKLRDHATIEPFPENEEIKGILRRLVQLLKRHRDVFFLDVEAEIAPISIVITTLAMRAYEYCVRHHSFWDELEVLVETIRMMPHFIERSYNDGKVVYAVWNESTKDENFAERWNDEPERVNAFYRWHKAALDDFSEIRDAVGLDKITKKLERPFGEEIATVILEKRTDMISDARKSGALYATPTIGLSVGATGSSTRVPRNDFFGD